MLGHSGLGGLQGGTVRMQADAYFDTQEEALKAVQGRRAELRDEGMIVRWEKTGYDNWRVYSYPVDVMVDCAADGPWSTGLLQHSPDRNRGWVK
jgi:hypothetical protein